jgi:hypothetical protein
LIYEDLTAFEEVLTLWAYFGTPAFAAALEACQRSPGLALTTDLARKHAVTLKTRQ